MPATRGSGCPPPRLADRMKRNRELQDALSCPPSCPSSSRVGGSCDARDPEANEPFLGTGSPKEAEEENPVQCRICLESEGEAPASSLRGQNEGGSLARVTKDCGPRAGGGSWGGCSQPAPVKHSAHSARSKSATQQPTLSTQQLSTQQLSTRISHQQLQEGTGRERLASCLLMLVSRFPGRAGGQLVAPCSCKGSSKYVHRRVPGPVAVRQGGEGLLAVHTCKERFYLTVQQPPPGSQGGPVSACDTGHSASCSLGSAGTEPQTPQASHPPGCQGSDTAL